MRTLDEHRLDPLYYLPTDNPERDGDDFEMIEVRFPENARFETVRVGPHRYEHRAVGGDGSAAAAGPAVTSTTPHTNIPPEQLARAPGTEIISGEGTEEEHLWFAWFRLRAGSGPRRT